MNSQIQLLLVEDEQLIQLAMQDALEDGGFAVITASDGTQAMAVIDERHSELPALVTDIRLGTGPNGWQVAQHARELNPLIAIVYVTGDSGADWPAHGVPNSVLLHKPFADAQLLTAVATLLNDAAAHTWLPSQLSDGRSDSSLLPTDARISKVRTC